MWRNIKKETVDASSVGSFLQVFGSAGPTVNHLSSDRALKFSEYLSSLLKEKEEIPFVSMKAVISCAWFLSKTTARRAYRIACSVPGHPSLQMTFPTCSIKYFAIVLEIKSKCLKFISIKKLQALPRHIISWSLDEFSHFPMFTYQNLRWAAKRSKHCWSLSYCQTESSTLEIYQKFRILILLSP